VSGPPVGWRSKARSTRLVSEELLDGRLFPNLASPDFSFLREIKERLHRDVRQLRSAITPPSS